VRPTVLVCEDEAPLRMLITATLEGSGYDIVEAKDGDESLELARGARPDLILLDMMMPGRSGLQVLEELRQEPGMAQTPVIMVTARAQARDREAAVRAGATQFVTKPFSPRKLAGVVEELLDGGR
jgi:CheY-like chemotaxis protein